MQEIEEETIYDTMEAIMPLFDKYNPTYQEITAILMAMHVNLALSLGIPKDQIVQFVESACKTYHKNREIMEEQSHVS